LKAVARPEEKNKNKNCQSEWKQSVRKRADAVMAGTDPVCNYDGD